LFAADYQHTGLLKGIALADADRAIGAMKKAIDRMQQLPELFAKDQKEMKKLTRDKQWLGDDIWSL
jgi:C4-dicarboxylate-specific signal transduction histidine kinase